MRTPLVLSTILVTASLAHAEPMAVHATADASAPSTYVATGLMLGGAGSHTAGGVTVDLGERITSSLWLHVGGTAAADGELFGGQGRYLAGYAGFEASSCHPGDKVCAFVGGDVGYAQSNYSDWSFDGTMSSSDDGVIGVVRAGLDIGGTHVRWRPGVEATLVGPAAGAFTQSLVYRF